MKLILLLSFVAVGAMAFPEKRNSQCNSMCPMYVIQFCGSDGKTYTSNECFIKSQMCREGRNDFDAFTTLHMGACTGEELIGEPKTTVAVSNEKRNSHCNTFCPMYMIQFCGSDGKTYTSNECFIKSQMCEEGRNDFDAFTTLHMGACTGEELIGEPKTTVAVTNEKRAAHCNSFCPMYIIEFCGSDGVTYNSNPCFIQSRMCAEGKNDFATFTTLHMGACTGDELIAEPKTTTVAPAETTVAP